MNVLIRIADFITETFGNVIVGILAYVSSFLSTLFIAVFLLFLFWLFIKFYNWYAG